MRGPHGHARIRPCDAFPAPALRCGVVAGRAGDDALDRSFTMAAGTPTAIFLFGLIARLLARAHRPAQLRRRVRGLGPRQGPAPG